MFKEVSVDWKQVSFYKPDDIPFLDKTLSGVYLIWDGRMGEVIYIGRGNIFQRLSDNFSDEHLKFHLDNRYMYLTYSSVPEQKQAGLLRYLTEKYEPSIRNYDSLTEIIKPNYGPPEIPYLKVYPAELKLLK